MVPSVRTSAALAVAAALLLTLAGCPAGSTSDAAASSTPAPGPATTSATVATTIPGTLYYQSDTGGEANTISQLRTNALTQVASGLNGHDAAVSPDGRLAAWGESGTGRIVLHHLDGSGHRTLNASSYRMRFSPDSRKIVYEDKVRGYPSVRVINVDGTGSRELARTGWSPVWSADGAWIVYLATPYPLAPKLTIVRPDGTGARTVAMQVGSDRVYHIAAVSPDGSQVRVYTVCGDCDAPAPVRHKGTTIVDTATGQATPLVADQGRPVSQLWTADGRTLLRVQTAEGTTQAYVLELRGADGTVLARQPEPPAIAASRSSLVMYVP